MTLWSIVLAALVPLLLLGVPVSFSMLIAGALGVSLKLGLEPLGGMLAYAPYDRVAGYTLSTIPMFILMAEFLRAGRFAKDLFDVSFAFVGQWRGGVSYAALGGGVLLAAVSGSSTAAAGSLASAAFPEMRRLGYDAGFSAALIAVVGTLAIMIPPSLGLILYGVFTETSVGRLLLAGLVPGILTGAGYAITIYLLIRTKAHDFPRGSVVPEPRTRWLALRSALPALALLLGMLGALYTGFITASEVGAVGALAALILALAMRRASLKEIWAAAKRATRVSASILTIVGFSAVIGVFLALEGTTQSLLSTVADSGLRPSLVLFSVLLMLILLGTFLDQLAILVLTLPLTFPLLTSAGYDPIWLGVIFVKTAEIGLVTPPMGLNVFVVASATGTPSSRIFPYIWPFVTVETVLLALFVMFPGLALWLPSTAFG